MGRAQHIEQLEHHLTESSAKIEAIEARLQTHDPKGREVYELELQELKDRQREVEQHLAKVKLDEAESWSEDDFGHALLEVFDDIGRKLDHLLSRVPDKAKPN